ncbi:MAG: Gfo/Idh/MocA family oxidoreductase [Candidatus Omnitrophica bacterium]|nr:Gfo/Idh/MocA family oxidoreductase [Candidatus Omnitrophota bacterium]
MSTLKVAVVGTGHLGSIHAKLYKEIENCELIGISDIDRARLDAVSRELNVPGYSDYRELFDKADAVSVAVPTRLHYAVAGDFLNHGIPVLVEKPFTLTLKEANTLIKTAKSKNLTLQVGHIERFNSAFNATKELIDRPKFIECHRLSPFPNRSLDVGAVLDLMIHDIDIVLGLVSSKIKRIESVGINVLTQYEDIANTRITFQDGCVANLTASRISDESMRKIRIFQKNAYISLDYKEAKASIYKKDGVKITKTDLPIEKEQPLKKELSSFVQCVRTRTEPLVSGAVAAGALKVALQIQKQIWRKNIF